MINSYHLTGDTAVVVKDGKTFTVARGAPNFALLKEAILAENPNAIEDALSLGSALSTWSKGQFSLSGGKILYKNDAIPSALSQRIMQAVSQGINPDSFLRFYERLAKNPSSRSERQLFSFLEHQGIPIQEDGTILAYKAVRKDYKDHWTGTVDNRVGVVNEMPRNRISDDPNVACDFGFHVGALDYARSYHHGESIMVICRVDPADVVCIPYDSHQQKMRVCRYEVVGHHGTKLPLVAGKEPTPPPPAKTVKRKFHQEKEGKKKKKKVALVKKPLVKKPLAKKPIHGFRAGARPRAKRGSVFYRFNRMDETKLLEQPIGDLRRYAASDLLIYGASKIPGGKTALVARILEVRDGV